MMPVEQPIFESEPTPAFRRIYIIGGPGSGKSTLARALGEQLDLPAFHLDTVAFEGKDFHERPLAQRLAMVHEIAVQPRWIAEGIFLDWVEELLRAADVIVWLDGVLWKEAAWRIVARFAHFAWLEVKRQRGARKFLRFQDYRLHLGQLIRVLFTSHGYYHRALVQANGNLRDVTRAATSAALAPYQSKVMHCRTRADLQAILSENTRAASTAVVPMPLPDSNS